MASSKRARSRSSSRCSRVAQAAGPDSGGATGATGSMVSAGAGSCLRSGAAGSACGGGASGATAGSAATGAAAVAVTAGAWTGSSSGAASVVTGVSSAARGDSTVAGASGSAGGWTGSRSSGGRRPDRRLRSRSRPSRAAAARTSRVGRFIVPPGRGQRRCLTGVTGVRPGASPRTAHAPRPRPCADRGSTESAGPGTGRRFP